jgi:hypothetical protein
MPDNSGDTSPEGQASNCDGATAIALSVRHALTKKIKVCIDKAEREAGKAEHAAKKAEAPVAPIDRSMDIPEDLIKAAP